MVSLDQYMKHLITIGRKSITDMTYNERCILCGYILLDHGNRTPESELFHKLLITGDVNDERSFLSLLKDNAIEYCTDSINKLFSDKLNEKE